MNILKRIKNLWELSAYIPEMDDHDKYYAIRKGIPTIQHRPATIIQPEQEDPFKEDD